MDFYLDELRQAFYKIASNMLENLENLKAKGEEFLKQQLKEGENKRYRSLIETSGISDRQILQIEKDWVEFLQKIEVNGNRRWFKTQRRIRVADVDMPPKTENFAADFLLKSSDHGRRGDHHGHRKRDRGHRDADNEA